MFNIATLKTALTGLIGFRDSPDATVAKIATDLTASSSGQYWDDAHPILHTDNLYYSSPNFEGMNYAAYGVATYGIGDKVISSSVAWQSQVAANQGHAPAVGSYWETCFSAWLREKTNSSVAKLFNRLATDKKLSGSTKSIFANLLLFEGDGKLSDTITKSGRLVGLAINPRRINNIQVVLNQIGLQFTVAQTNLPIYLWHSSRKGAVITQNVTTTGTNQFNWNALTNFILNYVTYSGDVDSGGTWYLGYFETAITGSAVNKTYDFYAGPCVGCSGTQGNVTKYNLWSKYVDIMPFYVTSGNLDGTNLPALENIVYDETTNFGLNLSLTVKPDITEIVTSNLSLVTYPLAMQFANDMLEWMAYNPAVRINPNRVNASQDVLMYELSGATNTKSDGIKIELTKAINGLAEDLSNLSAALPASNPSGIRIGAI
jgi:hypothetical protein